MLLVSLEYVAVVQLAPSSNGIVTSLQISYHLPPYASMLIFCLVSGLAHEPASNPAFTAEIKTIIIMFKNFLS